ncbi:MAG: peptidoglycan-binding protein [Acidobacteriota bacterium]|nr:peptidoglycan-binding protein [Acidobacteriota bacterium]
MRKFIFTLLVTFLVGISINAQTTPTPSPSNAQATTETKPKRQIFRATKDQIMQAQKQLKVEETGKLSDETRAAIKKFQPENGLKATGTLNRATLEKMGIELTDKQKEIPVSPNSLASAETDKPTDSTKPKRTIFRASKEQIMEAQKMLKTNNFYAGEATGKLDDATRDGLKKYQAANAVSPTGTLNQVTLEKMGIALTDKQKENSMKNSQ